jgi:hypothetical protein
MALWGTTDDLAAKPKIFGRSLLATGITNDPRAGVYATTAGWCKLGADGVSDEVLVAIRGLSTRTGTDSGFLAAGLAAASITSVNWNDMTYSVAAGDTVSVSVNFNETVTVSAGTPTLLVTNDTVSRNLTLTYNAGLSKPNRLTFIRIIAAGQTGQWVDGDVLSIAAQSIAGGATIHDTVAGAGTAAVVAISTGIGDAAGDVTVVT